MSFPRLPEAELIILTALYPSVIINMQLGFQFRFCILEVACGLVWFLSASTNVYHGQGQKVQKVMVQPVNFIFRHLQNRSRIQVWPYEQVNMHIEGCIIDFDEYINVVSDGAEELRSKTKSRKQLGRIMLKGCNITLLQSVSNYNRND